MTAPGPSIDPTSGEVTFVVAAAHGATPERVWFHLRNFGADTTMSPEYHDSHRWVARIPRPPVDRLEYLISWRHPDGSTSMGLDPGNPNRVPGVFGDHSVLLFDEYRAPAWLRGAAFVDGMGTAVAVGEADPDAGVVVAGALWSPHDSTPAEPLPLLVANDGREYAELGDLTGFLGVLGQEQPALRCRALLLDPVDRDRSYSASPSYGRLLTGALLPEVSAGWATRGLPVGMGASLGAVAMLDAALRRPGSFGGLLLQSGSFFTDRFDGHESGFRFYRRLTRFTADATAEPERYRGLRIAMTCGTGEENLDNNRELAQRLRGIGVEVEFVANRDAHNYVAWRDCWEPTLARLMARVWGP